MNIKNGDIITIQGYKHNGEVYRKWDNTIVLENNEDSIICVNNKTTVTEIDGRSWKTKEPAILFFYKHSWFNVIAQFKKSGIYYYCNIATPYVIENNTIKYIDYDLDLRVFPDGSFRVLDRGEYEYNRNEMNYSNNINRVVNYELNSLIKKYKEKSGPFCLKTLQNYYEMYQKMPIFQDKNKKMKKNEKN